MRTTRRRFVAAVGIGALAGCAGGADSEPEAEPTTTAALSTTRSATNPEDAVLTAEETLTLPMEPSELESLAVSGGPPKDGIPSIDEPTFVRPDAVKFLAPGDPVFGVALNGVVKAYPQKILIQHEIVNDRLGDLPVAVTCRVN
jgi:hypothetical protein